jgi:hypothetical protein
MTSERTQAYGRVMRTLEQAGGTTLHDPERERIREAADTLVLAQSTTEAGVALADVERLCEQLVASGRWSAERAAALQGELLACGPMMSVA